MPRNGTMFCRGSIVGGKRTFQESESYFDRADLSGVAAANLELIDAADPLRACPDEPSAAPCSKALAGSAADVVDNFELYKDVISPLTRV